MKVNLLILSFVLLCSVAKAQTDSFDVFIYKPPEFFTKSILPSRAQFNLTNPDKPFFQFFHLLVSTGLVGLWPLYMIWNTLRLDRIPAVMLTLFFLTCLLFFAPFTSQVSCSAFILPFLINRMDERI